MALHIDLMNLKQVKLIQEKAVNTSVTVFTLLAQKKLQIIIEQQEHQISLKVTYIA